jgi:hypothetical protein
MANKVSPPVPAGLKWCHGCNAALPLDRFAKRSSRGRTVRQSRCRSCHAIQKQEQRVNARRRYAHWTALEEQARRSPPVPLELPQELDSALLPLR